MKPCSQDNFRRAVRHALVDQGLTVTALAVRLGKARNTVSLAINHSVFPSVRQAITKELNLKIASL